MAYTLSMKVLILGSVALPVPPPMQGGTERIAYYQAKGLSERGHAVTLVAAQGSSGNEGYAVVEIGGGDTVVGTKIVQGKAQPLGSTEQPGEFLESSRNLRKEAVYLAQVSAYLLEHGAEFDVILNNMRAGESLFMPIVKRIGKTMLNVMHLPLFEQLVNEFKQQHQPVITISNAQRNDYPDLNYVGTVYNCVDVSLYKPGNVANPPYLLMMGSVAPHKNQKTGIDIAKSVGMPIILAGKISNPTYYSTVIAPLIDGKEARHIGEIGLEEKVTLYQGATALLFPVLWDEPFGLVMIEAMACGTPVVAYNRGAVPEVVVDGKTGFIVDTQAHMVEAVKKIGSIDRNSCVSHIKKNFTVEKMIDSLEKILLSSVTH